MYSVFSIEWNRVILALAIGRGQTAEPLNQRRLFFMPEVDSYSSLGDFPCGCACWSVLQCSYRWPIPATSPPCCPKSAIYFLFLLARNSGFPFNCFLFLYSQLRAAAQQGMNSRDQSPEGRRQQPRRSSGDSQFDYLNWVFVIWNYVFANCEVGIRIKIIFMYLYK
jgi:hypothetical protein